MLGVAANIALIVLEPGATLYTVKMTIDGKSSLTFDRQMGEASIPGTYQYQLVVKSPNQVPSTSKVFENIAVVSLFNKISEKW